MRFCNDQKFCLGSARLILLYHVVAKDLGEAERRRYLPTIPYCHNAENSFWRAAFAFF